MVLLMKLYYTDNLHFSPWNRDSICGAITFPQCGHETFGVSNLDTDILDLVSSLVALPLFHGVTPFLEPINPCSNALALADRR